MFWRWIKKKLIPFKKVNMKKKKRKELFSKGYF